MRIYAHLMAALILGLPLTALAQSSVHIGDFKPTRVVGTDYLATLANLINVFLLWAGIAALLVAFYGGYQYITAGGDASAAAKARSTILGAVIGIIIITLSYILVLRLVHVPACDTTSDTAAECLDKNN